MESVTARELPLYCDPVLDQLRILQAAFPELGRGSCYVGSAAAGGGLALVPNIWKEDSRFRENYGDLCHQVIALIEKQRGDWIRNYRATEMVNERLHTLEETTAAMRRLSERQKHADILCLSLPETYDYPGLAANDAREEMLTAGHFGLCLFTVSILLLTHPGWASKESDPGLLCAGSTLTRENPDRRHDVPAFAFRTGHLWLGSFERRYQSHGYQLVYA